MKFIYSLGTLAVAAYIASALMSYFWLITWATQHGKSQLLCLFSGLAKYLWL